MKTNPVAKLYDCLNPEERFCLIVAAGARGDDSEQDRLKHAGKRFNVSMRDTAPWAHAFDEIATQIFIELMEETAKYSDAFHQWCDADEIWNAGQTLDESADEDDAAESESGGGDAVPSNEDETAATEREGVDAVPPKEDTERTLQDRQLDIYLAHGFLLKTKADGWKLFCQRLSIPPFAHWQLLTGFERLQRALKRVEDNEVRPGAAFLPEGMLRFLRTIRRANKSEPTLANLISAQGFAAE